MNCELGTLSAEYLSNCIIQTSAAKGDGCIQNFHGISAIRLLSTILSAEACMSEMRRCLELYRL